MILQGFYKDLVGISWGYLDVSDKGRRRIPFKWPLNWGNYYEPGHFGVPYFCLKTHILGITTSNNRHSPKIWDETKENFGIWRPKAWRIVPPKCHVSGKVTVLLWSPVQANRRYAISPRSLFVSDGFKASQLNWPKLGYESLKMGICLPEMP